MDIFIAGGEGLTHKRQKALFEAGCRNRLVSFYAGNALGRVIKAADEFSQENLSEKIIEFEKIVQSE